MICDLLLLGRLGTALDPFALSHAGAISDALLEDPAIFRDTGIPLAALEEEKTVVPEIVVPLYDLFVRPSGRVSLHFSVGHPVEIGAQVDAGFIQRFGGGFLFEVPNWLLHASSPEE